MPRYLLSDAVSLPLVQERNSELGAAACGEIPIIEGAADDKERRTKTTRAVDYENYLVAQNLSRPRGDKPRNKPVNGFSGASQPHRPWIRDSYLHQMLGLITTSLKDLRGFHELRSIDPKISRRLSSSAWRWRSYSW